LLVSTTIDGAIPFATFSAANNISSNMASFTNTQHLTHTHGPFTHHHHHAQAHSIQFSVACSWHSNQSSHSFHPFQHSPISAQHASFQFHLKLVFNQHQCQHFSISIQLVSQCSFKFSNSFSSFKPNTNSTHRVIISQHQHHTFKQPHTVSIIFSTAASFNGSSFCLGAVITHSQCCITSLHISHSSHIHPSGIITSTLPGSTLSISHSSSSHSSSCITHSSSFNSNTFHTSTSWQVSSHTSNTSPNILALHSHRAGFNTASSSLFRQAFRVSHIQAFGSIKPFGFFKFARLNKTQIHSQAKSLATRQGFPNNIQAHWAFQKAFSGSPTTFGGRHLHFRQGLYFSHKKKGPHLFWDGLPSTGTVFFCTFLTTYGLEFAFLTL